MGIGLLEMAKTLGVSPVYLSKVEQDEFPPPARDRVAEIATILHCPADQLLVRAGKGPLTAQGAAPRPATSTAALATTKVAAIGDVDPGADQGRTIFFHNGCKFELPRAYTFQIQTMDNMPSEADLCRALRRAVMALCGRRQPKLATFFTGHLPDGSPSRGHGCIHLGYFCDQHTRLLAVVPPYALAHRPPTTNEVENALLLETALKELSRVFVPSWGMLRLQPAPPAAEDVWLGSSATWQNQTRYIPEHKASSKQSLAANVVKSCVEMGLPEPNVLVQTSADEPSIQLKFDTAVSGPILIGRTRHFGGGLFRVQHPRAIE